MILKQYGVELRRLTKKDIETVRRNRNAPFIQERMAFQGEISPSQQEDWFQSIDNKYNYYFIINYNNEDIGVINAKNIDEASGIGEGGIFIWKMEAWESGIPSLASMILLDFVFLESKFSNKSCIRIMKSNEAAVSFNRALGYVLLPYQDNQDYQWYILTKEDYELKVKKYRKLAKKLSGDYQKMEVVGEPSDKHLDRINEYLTESNSN